MNNIYLKKLIEQETLNVKLQLVQEHLQLAKEEFSQKQKDFNKTNNLNVLSEQDNTSDEWPAPKDKVQQFFKNLQKKGIPVKEKSYFNFMKMDLYMILINKKQLAMHMIITKYNYYQKIQMQ